METINKLLEGLNVDLSDLMDRNSLLDESSLYFVAKHLAHLYSSKDSDIAAGRLMAYILTKSAPKSTDEYLKVLGPILNDRTRNFFSNNKDDIDATIEEYSHLDFNLGWLGISSIIHNYLLRETYKAQPYESIGLMWMRIAIDIFAEEGFKKVKQCFLAFRLGQCMPASPFMYSAGTKDNQHRSCFLWSIQDNIYSILDDGVTTAGIISKYRGGCGIDISRLRNSKISNVGIARGLMPWLRLYDQIPRSVDQSGKRKGAITVHIRSHHLNIQEAITSMLKHGQHKDLRIDNIQISVMFSWLFWERFKNDDYWTLFCPNLTPNLNDVYGIEFEREYTKYEADADLMKKSTRIKARDLALHLCSVQTRSSIPYVLNFDAFNFKSNHRHFGVIRSSNLCLEIMEHYNDGEIASCNLHSISLKCAVKEEFFNDLEQGIYKSFQQCYDFDLIGKVSMQCVDNLDKSIDVGMYAISHKMKSNNERNRPLGIGCSGFADALYMLDLCFESEETKIFNRLLFACIYFNALCESVRLSVVRGTCEGHYGSPASEGKLQFDLWAEEYELLDKMGRINSNIRKKEDDIPVDPLSWGQKPFSFYHNDINVVIEPSWSSLKSAIKQYGLRNTLLIAHMPTATSSQPLGNTETTEPPQSNIYLRRLVSGDFPVLNSHMVNDLKRLNAWNIYTAQLIMSDGGSLNLLEKFIEENPSYYPKYINKDRLRWIIKKYKTIWDIKQSTLLNLVADRARYVDQSMSTNIYIKEPSKNKVCCILRYGFDLGLKTVLYYLRVNPNLKRPQTSIEPFISKFIDKNSDFVFADKQNKEICTSCQ